MSASDRRKIPPKVLARFDMESNTKDDEESTSCCWNENCCCCCFTICGFKRSTVTRINYTVFLLTGTIICFVTLIPNLRRWLGKIPGFCTELLRPETCDNLVGYSAVYRVCFAMAVFYFLMSLVLVGVEGDEGSRAKFHHGFWYIKILLIIGITIGSLFIPHHSNFHVFWMYVGLAGGFLFILIQLLLLIDFAHCWNGSWVGKMETANSRCIARSWYFALLGSTLFLYLLSVVAVALFYILFAHDASCKTNRFFITFNLCHCVIATVISVLPPIQKAQSGTGLLQAAVVTSYSMLLTWSALSHEPDDTCNPRDTLLSGYNETTRLNLQAVFSGVLTFILLIYASFSTAMSASKLSKWTPSNYDEKPSSSNKNANESYNFSFFHFILFLASLNVMMTLTNWYSPNTGSPNLMYLSRSWPAVWVKMGSSSACVWLYIWTLLAPVLRPLFQQYADEIHGSFHDNDFKKDHKKYKENIETVSPQKKPAPNMNKNIEQKQASNTKDLQKRNTENIERVSPQKKPAPNMKENVEHKQASDTNDLQKRNTENIERQGSANSVHIEKHQSNDKPPKSTTPPCNTHDLNIDRIPLKKPRKSVTPPCVTITDPVNVTHGSMSRRNSKNSSRAPTPMTQSDKEMFRLQGKVMRLQEKIAKLQNKVASLQGLNI